MQESEAILKKYWGYDGFRPLQKEIVDSIIAGNDTLALLPTGGGKSICFQVPAMAKEGICIVVSPLVALMKDQVENLERVGIKAAYLHSGQRKHEIDMLLDNAVFGAFKFLYVSPERLQTEIFRERYSRMNVSLLAIDEAHCISQWGYDFRPPYLQIAELRKLKPEVPVLALTASATPEVQEDIVVKLEFGTSHLVFSKSFDRPNLIYAVTQTNDKQDRILYALSKRPGTGIVYVRNRRQTKDIAYWLSTQGISADYYHAGLSIQDRSERQMAWKQGATRIMVCTNAFGMGIDKPDVRLVIHVGVPDSLEAYYQEAGRAGRDGKKSFAVMLANENDLHQLQVNSSSMIPDIDLVKRVYECLGNYLQLPIGSGEGHSTTFDLIDFANHYNMTPADTLQAFKVLELNGILQLGDAFYRPSTLHFKLSGSELYSFMVANAAHEPLIKAILRTSPGVTDGFSRIKEKDLVKLLKTTTSDVVQKIKVLESLSILKYSPSSDKPILTMLQSRLEIKNLLLDRDYLEKRRKVYQTKADGIIQFVKAEKCRTKILLAYFGEKVDVNCGHCDFCLNQKTDKSMNLEQRVLGFLTANPAGISIEKVKSQFNVQDSHFMSVMRYLMDEGKLELSNGLLRKT